MNSTLRVGAIALLILSATACGKNKEAMPKTAAQAAAEKAANDKAVRDNPVWGTQIQSLDKAKSLQSGLDAQAEEARKKIDDSSK